MSATTCDRFLGGKILVRQPTRGFRAGLDAVMLAAAVPAKSGEMVLELGSGAGTASLCLAARVDCSITAIEIDAELVSVAADNALLNDFNGRVRFLEGDALEFRLRVMFDHVFANPPFHDAAGRASPQAERARARHDQEHLAAWIAAGLRRTRPKGTFTVILRADRLDEVLAVTDGGNAVVVFPLWPKQGEPAKRVIIQVQKGRRSGLTLLPGLVLHGPSGKYTREADAVLRGETRLDLSQRH